MVPRQHVIGFFLMGLVNNFSYVVMLSAAEDILTGYAGYVLFCDIAPCLIVKVTAPFWAHKVPYDMRIMFITITAILSFYLTAVMPSPILKLLGVVVASVSSGFGEYTMLAFTSFFDKSVVDAWSSGTGFAGIAGAGTYLLLHVIIKLSATNTLLLGGLVPIAYAISYYACLKTHYHTQLECPSSTEASLNETEKPNSGEINDSLIEKEHLVAFSESDRHENNSDLDIITPRNTIFDKYNDNEEEQLDDNSLFLDTGSMNSNVMHHMTITERLERTKALSSYMIPLALVYFAEYFINTGISSTFAFRDMKRETFYISANFVYQVGVFISRSSRNYFPIRTLWPLPALQFLNILLFLLQSLFSILPYSYEVFPFILFEGLLGGAAYVNVYALITEKVDPLYLEFSLGAASMADTFGILVASGCAIVTEHALLKYNGNG